MNRDRFIRQRRDDWEQFEALLARTQAESLSHWSGQDVTLLSTLYRSICYDLSLVQSREWGQQLEQYLNDLVAHGHNRLYRTPPRSLQFSLQFLSGGFPRLLRRRRSFFFVSLALFCVPFFCALVAGIVDPVLAERLVDRSAMQQADQTDKDASHDDMDANDAAERSLMAGFYVWHNVGIAFRCFALGVFFGIGSVVTLLFNGLVLGAITGYLIYRGHSNHFFSFAISHGSFELTAVIVAGAAGLLLGWGMIHPGERSRRESLRVHGRDAIQLATGAGFMLAIAAAVEAWFSPLAIAPLIKYLVGAILWGVVYVYLVYGGRPEKVRDES